jgi:hypothetical protein
MRHVDDAQARLDSKHDPFADRDRTVLDAEVGQEEHRCRLTLTRIAAARGHSA